jgi:hypothetical protein
MASSAEQPAFFIQVEPEAIGDHMLLSGGKVIEGSEENLDAAADLARKAAGKFADIFTDVGPKAGEVAFGLTFEAEGGVPVLAKGKVGASITVTLKWEKP